ncbi:MAG: bifunctional ornithine acetyltransferase/N-acetylglutamate synthase, partial [Clostridia bacterium]|nr:bifunctional ornithine acetyltransferase/N-acetylglutamate synthase [Clostridia bacterium]
QKGTIDVCKCGKTYEFDEDVAKVILLEDEVEILCNMNSGDATATAFGCDLSYDYVKINGDYRS